MDYTLDTGNRRLCAAGCRKTSQQMLGVHDWLADIKIDSELSNYVEVQFKNTRKGFYLNSNGLALEKGDIVAVESNPGHDIGTVTATGYLVVLQMKKYNYDVKRNEVRRVYRKARPADLEKWEEAKSLEHDAMIKSRQIAKDLHLEMKIGDVEYQGDGNRAIFYYIADQRVDFRELIKVLASTFKVRIEMKQIGARQEAGRIGGTGSCGRELCCSTFLTNFSSVGTHAARIQDLSMNAQKLAGQCAKLKCCLNFELDNYIEALKEFPSKDLELKTEEGTYRFAKLDVFARKMTYFLTGADVKAFVEVGLDRVKEVIAMNEAGELPDMLCEEPKGGKPKPKDISASLSEDSITRFDKPLRRKKGQKGGNRQGRQGGPRNQDEGRERGQAPDNRPRREDRQGRPNRDGDRGPRQPRGEQGQRPPRNGGERNDNRRDNRQRRPDNRPRRDNNNNNNDNNARRSDEKPRNDGEN